MIAKILYWVMFAAIVAGFLSIVLIAFLGGMYASTYV